MSSLFLHRLSKTFKHGGKLVHALNDVTLNVEPGELVVVVGPSGCGKTTLLRSIAGLEKPDAGEIRLGDRMVNHIPPRKRDMAMVFQSHALYPHMTVYRNIAFPLKMRRTPKPEVDRKVREAAEMLGIAHLLDRKPHQLSGGEQQRVALGRAIVRQPRIFLFDEPLSNLDPSLRLRMRSEIKALHRQLRATMLYVTHDQEEAMTLGDRLCVLRDGQVQQLAPPIAVYEAPANRFVAEFFGHPPMNFLPARVRQTGQLTRAFVGNREVVLPPLEGIHVESTPVFLGVRPHHLRLCGSGETATDGWSHLANGRVEFVENLGDSITVHVLTDEGQPLNVRSAAQTNFSVGAPVCVILDARKALLFRDGKISERLL